jgi:hypothetical protein
VDCFVLPRRLAMTDSSLPRGAIIVLSIIVIVDIVTFIILVLWWTLLLLLFAACAWVRDDTDTVFRLLRRLSRLTEWKRRRSVPCLLSCAFLRCLGLQCTIPMVNSIVCSAVHIHQRVNNGRSIKK